MRAIQSVTSRKEMWAELFERYARKSQYIKISVLNKKLITKSDISDPFSQLESLFNKLEILMSPIDEKMQVAVLLVSVSSTNSFEATTAAIKTTKKMMQHGIMSLLV